VLWAERVFKKAAWPVLAIMPNNMICLLAGATGMAWLGFAVVNVTGTLVRVLGVRLIGDAFSDPILSLNAWIGRNRVWLTFITFGIAFAIALRSAHRGRDQVETPRELSEELDEAVADPPPEPAVDDVDEDDTHGV
jgi:membrane protein DedA with SNARE-associated domain